ncbi:MAG: ADP-ribosylglycohydrolase family protein [Pseudomonadota bacterium]
MTLSAHQRDRAIGAFIGLAVGDALGTTLEFSRRDSYPHLTDMVGGGPFELEPGVWTDDTSMAMALAESLVAKPNFDPRDLMSRFVNWWKRGQYSPTGECFDIGLTTRHALASFETSGEPYAGSTDPRSAGNGSLMRLSPVALWGLGKPASQVEQVARDQSRTTHGAPQSLDACVAYSAMLITAIETGDLGKALSAGRIDGLGDTIREIVNGSWVDKARGEIRSSGYVAHSLEAALWCVDDSDDFASAVLLAANLGDDADTTAAITGQLAGALYGLSNMPAHWLEKLAWREELEGLAERLIEA